MTSRARKRRDTTPEPGGRFAYGRLERVIHEKARLGILTSLLGAPEGLLFTELKELCALTDGNLSRHIQVLQEAGLVEVWKGFRGNRPQTLCRITAEGRTRFEQYLEELERVVADAARAAEHARSTAPPRTGSPRWLDGLSPA
ncbi:MAG TPA: transcriptional regulator [Planctomycetaceae bacterium]|nr:transcriptional regulator [Planctomycetaceae bacterium]